MSIRDNDAQDFAHVLALRCRAFNDAGVGWVYPRSHLIQATSGGSFVIQISRSFRTKDPITLSLESRQQSAVEKPALQALMGRDKD